MSTQLTDAEHDAINYLYGGDDVQIECYSVAWVRIRYPQECWSVFHKEKMTQPAGARMVVERAKVDGRFGSCYTCESCVAKSRAELER